MDLQVVVTPEISATVGVATAFAINPIAGAAVFAASKVLGPLWSRFQLYVLSCYRNGRTTQD